MAEEITLQPAGIIPYPTQPYIFPMVDYSLRERIEIAEESSDSFLGEYANLRDYYFPPHHPLPLYGPEGVAIKNWGRALFYLTQSPKEKEALEYWVNLQTGCTGVNRIYAGVKILYEIGENTPFSIFTLPAFGDFGTLIHPKCINQYGLPFLFNIFDFSITQIPNIRSSHTFSLVHNSLQNL